MALTTAQKAAIKADILANSDLNVFPQGSDGAFGIAALYNTVTATDVWRTDAPVSAINDGIDYTKFTPTDAADGTAIYTNRVLAIQTKQMNLQNMLVGKDKIDASKANIRAGIRDAVIQLPAGTGGALISAAGASGVNVLTPMVRKANRIEKLFATTQATTGTVTANLLANVANSSFSGEGNITYQDVQAARES